MYVINVFVFSAEKTHMKQTKKPSRNAKPGAMFKVYGLYAWKCLFWLSLTETNVKTSKNILWILATLNNMFQLKTYL